jgi:hypothetical protein
VDERSKVWNMILLYNKQVKSLVGMGSVLLTFTKCSGCDYRTVKLQVVDDCQCAWLCARKRRQGKHAKVPYPSLSPSHTFAILIYSIRWNKMYFLVSCLCSVFYQRVCNITGKPIET